ncbi:asparagine synthetase [glutamine-hydrolyzing]-like isoform X2 [Bolinopsis microptera]|uniref:asparagine synthetase [glutamine-hydrolyzing]-like isoform X2 n=1 Tax=Bolinopsis microptera TaxID=2820187 RepID=UPI003078E8C9
MLVSWDQEFIADKNKIFHYGCIKLVIRFQKLNTVDDRPAWFAVYPPRVVAGHFSYKASPRKSKSNDQAWYPECTSIDNIPYAAKYRPISVDIYPGVVLIANADIFNYHDLQEKYKFQLQSDRPEEILIHMFKLHGMSAALNEIQGEYSFILCDNEMSYLVRDGTGTRGLYYLEYPHRSGPMCAALRASLLASYQHSVGQIRHVPLGSIIYGDNKKEWRRKVFTTVFQQPSYRLDLLSPPCKNGISALGQMRMRLRNIIKQNITCRSKSSTIGKVGLLLSGGLNSRVIGNVLRDSQVKGLKTFFVGTKSAHERKSSENGAKSISSIHHDIMFDPKQAFEDIPKVIELAETYDTSSIRKALLLFTVCKYIHQHNAIDVLFCGEGLDDIAGSQIYYKQAKCAQEFQTTLENNLKRPIGREVYDKIGSWFGIRIVFPFLDPLFTSHYLNFSAEDRIPRFGIEKYFFRVCLDHSDLITEEVLWKHREDWVDSASSYDRFWVKTLQRLCSKFVDNEEFQKRDETYSHNSPLTTEEFLYRQTFEKIFPDQQSLVPAIFRPSFGVGTDPSPRTWNIYPQHLCVDFLATVRMMI